MGILLDMWKPFKKLLDKVFPKEDRYPSIGLVWGPILVDRELITITEKEIVDPTCAPLVYSKFRLHYRHPKNQHITVDSLGVVYDPIDGQLFFVGESGCDLFPLSDIFDLGLIAQARDLILSREPALLTRRLLAEFLRVDPNSITVFH